MIPVPCGVGKLMEPTVTGHSSRAGINPPPGDGVQCSVGAFNPVSKGQVPSFALVWTVATLLAARGHEYKRHFLHFAPP